MADKQGVFIRSCEEYGTPQYILDEPFLVQNCNEILSAFKEKYPKCRLYYPYKTNSTPHILRTIHDQGIGAEVSSLLELKLADRLNVGDTVFNSPGKTLEELIFAVEKSAVIIIDNLDELGRIKNALETTSREPILGIRLSQNGLKASEWSRFGVSLKEMPDVIRELNRMDLTLSGLHFHIGSGFRNASPYESALNNLGRLLKDKAFEEVVGDLHFIDVGGGIGAGGSRHKDVLDYALGFMEKISGVGGLSSLRGHSYSKVEAIQSFADRICTSFKRNINPVLGDVELWIEPGRWLVSTCTHMLSKVLSVKRDSVVIDGGINLLPNVLHENYPVVNLSDNVTTKTKVKVYGPLCMSNDRIASQVFGKRPAVGDILCMMNVGAYNISWSQQFIKPLARVVSMSEDGLKEVRREEDLEYRIGRDVGI